MPTLNFKGKAFIANHHMGVPYHTLVPKKSKSLTKEPKLEDNLIVHGDNLKALKALLPTYAGRVKCIYIDPPYNTGNEKWAYNDNVNSPMIQEWLGKVVDTEDLTRHDKWLCMMTPRLKLLKELLRDDGVIFISIDDNEVHHLRMLMDEIFGEDNFVANFVWRRRASSALAERLVSLDHEYVVVYCKANFNGFSGLQKDYANYNNPDNDPNGPWTLGDLTVGMTKKQRPNQFYVLVDPATGKKYPANPDRVWAFVKETMLQQIKNGRVCFPDDESKRPMLKRYQNDLKSHVNPISTWVKSISEKVEETANGDPSELKSGLTAEGTRLIQGLFGMTIFNYPKPKSLIRSFLKVATKEHDIILDSFAGSGTTAHAVLALNKEDGGNRRFILVECEDYADSVTAERVRRVIKGVPGAKNEALREGLGGTFSFFELGGSIEIEKLLAGKDLPSYMELARYVFYTATGQEFDEKKINEKRHFIGETKSHEVYLFYKPDVEYLKATALTLDHAKAFGAYKGKRRLVFAPTKYLDQNYLDEFRIDFAQLPFEIYRRVK